jgi:WD40 repeat protein
MQQPQLALAWSTAYNTLFSADNLGVVRSWQVDSWKEKHVFRSHTDMATSLVLIPNTPLLASGSLDSTIVIWDVNSGSKQRELKGLYIPQGIGYDFTIYLISQDTLRGCFRLPIVTSIDFF